MVVLAAEGTVDDPVVRHIPSVARVRVEDRRAGMALGVAGIVDRRPVERIIGHQIVEERFAVALGIGSGIAAQVLRDLAADQQ